MDFRTRKQMSEALGPDNRYFCSKYFRRQVDDPEQLWRYFIASGGAADFARRFDHAMSDLNRWYASEFHGRCVCEPELLWNYFMKFGMRGPDDDDGRPPLHLAS